jgi:hypothetical protein
VVMSPASLYPFEVDVIRRMKDGDVLRACQETTALNCGVDEGAIV